MRNFIFVVLFFNMTGTCRAEILETLPQNLSEEQQISLLRGYILWQEYLERPGMRYDFDQVIKGMSAAEAGKIVPCDDGELRIKIRQFQEQLLAKQTVDNLADAEAFLAKIAKEGAVEVVSGKLYYKLLKNGNTSIVQSESTPLLTYSLWSYNRWGEEMVVTFDDPTPISLQDAIPGFAQGVSGMSEGEVRKLFIHPDLAYGTYGKLDPNLLLIFEVKVVRSDSSAKK